MTYHILHRTGGVWSNFVGSRAEAEAELDRRNENDTGGTTEIHASFATQAEAETEQSILMSLGL
jgi:hypothetical protein